MTVLRSIAMAFAMFSTIRMPKIDWNEKSMRYSLAAFPLVGVVISALMAVWLWLASLMEVDRLVMALVMTLIPVAITGGIHIDGFADTVDALASHAEPEKKRQILKDSHIGAFAGIGICMYLIAYFVLAAQLDYEGSSWVHTARMVCLVPILERTMSGIASICFKGSKNEGMLHTFRAAAEKKGAVIALLVILAACVVYAYLFMHWLSATAIVVAVALVTIYVRRMANKQFGGMSGDIAGFYLQLLEIVMLALIGLLEAASL